MKVDLIDWDNALFQEIQRLLKCAEDKEAARPTTGNIDFMSAKKACKRVQRHVVVTRVDKAANYLCVMCKACCKREAMAEFNGPAYERVDGESLEVIVEDITEHQLAYLRLEYLPIPKVNVNFPNSKEYSLEPTKKQPARYLKPQQEDGTRRPTTRTHTIITRAAIVRFLRAF